MSTDLSLAAAERPRVSAIPGERALRHIDAVLLPLLALAVGMGCFSLFLLALGKPPAEFFALVYKAGFGTAFSWTNTLSRAAPLLLASLCVALPARLGLVIIGGEGAIVLGGVAAGALGMLAPGLPGGLGIALMALVAGLTGAVWIGAIGALRHLRGVNETISSLLMSYIAIALMHHLVEGPLRDPASLNKPSTAPLPSSWHVGLIPEIGVHWGLAAGLVACIVCSILVERTTFGFAARIVGGNARAATMQGLPTGLLTIGFCALGGLCAGLAGMFEVAAVQGSANASLAAGYGYTGILIAFLARHNSLAIIPCAVLLAGFEASSGLIQRRLDMPDATMLVFEGMMFILILLSETLRERLSLLTLIKRIRS
ncbi:ABC transporter permease [Allorhizobium sp. BGMRC 0089]|uniref:ABC transporter permease n=1 Tax=Allorhizobium sonneratiae TaxID=2934936 RepID=UPI0020349B63|nr:ABC transporter permease [Allorhizobium sonneratiae]MCM2292313.1 ABC transporter permease [Allorhizobium sonneratiae]